jgi:hypothetical protein
LSRIFLSHSSKDNFPAVAIHDWLSESGWDDVFLDLDPVQGIHPGERWERSLHESATRCEAVLFLVSHNWLSSDWCRREYELARKLNKSIFVVLIDDIALGDLPAYLTMTRQVVSLAAGEDHVMRRVRLPRTHEEGQVSFSSEGLARLKAGLTHAGLDPRFFSWPPASEPNRAPYRGLEPFEAVDAGIFFGRDAPVIEALDELRGLRERACPRLVVVLGASGAGKSSFLRAGLLPRLERDDANFLPLPTIRPERAALTGAHGLVAALASACAGRNMSITRAQLREAVAQGAAALRPHLRDLAARAQSASGAERPPTLILAVDQAEELFRAEGVEEGERLLALMRELMLADDPAVIALFVIRSDSYDSLEHAKALEGLSPKAISLLPMPRGAYQTVIEGPARRLAESGRKFEIDPSLTEVLLADLEKGGGSDALPLLAFTLEQLFLDHQAAGRLSRAEYDRFGGLKGAIEAAMVRVFAQADRDPRIPKESNARLALLRRGLIPWLAGIDPDTKTPRRRHAPAAQIPEEARPLIDLLVEQRLLTRSVDEATHTVTVEPAHEALLRQWGSLKGWLDEDFARLVILEGVQRAARDWDANARAAAWTAHTGARLEDAARLDERPDIAAMLNATDRAYLAACQRRESEQRSKELALAAAERRSAVRTRIFLAAASVLAIVALSAAIFGFRQAGVAESQRVAAEAQKGVAEKQTSIAQQERQAAEEQRGAAEQARASAEEQKAAAMAARASAEEQKAAAERAQAVAVAQKAVADKQTAIAEDNKVKAEQRSALLAASIAQSFTGNGSIDQALLLMLDAARVFDDASAPDAIRIALTKALEARQRNEIKPIFADAAVFETDNALILFDPATKDLWKLTNAISPARLLAGAAGDAAILKLRSSQNGTELVVLRADLTVERINATTGQRRKVATFSEPPKRPDATYQLDDTAITDDDLVVRQFTVDTGSQGSESASFVQVLDSETGSLLSGELKNVQSIFKRSQNGGVYAGDYDGNVFDVRPGKGVLAMNKTKLAASDGYVLRYGRCFTGMPAPVKAAVQKSLEDELPGLAFACRKFGSSYLITVTTHISSGTARSDTLFRADGTQTDVREALDKAVTGASQNNLTWVGLYRASATAEKEQLVVIVNRKAYVLEHSTDPNDADWSLLFEFSYPSLVGYGRLADGDRLITVETGGARIVAQDFGAQPRESFLSSPSAGIIGTDQPVDTLHKGTCVGYAIPRSDTVKLPDGRALVLDTASTSSGSDKHELRVAGPTNTVVTLGKDDEDAQCVDFSADWRRLLVMKKGAVVVYDFQNVLKTASLSGNEIASLSVPDVISALFADPAGEGIVIANFTNSVRLWRRGAGGAWSSTEIYSGDYPVRYAELDATGGRLIVMEDRGGADVAGTLYSVEAQTKWYDLGSDYKWLGATFTGGSDVVVSEHSTWTHVFPLLPLSALAGSADKALSPHCRPSSAKDYRASPCWPTTFR